MDLRVGFRIRSSPKVQTMRAKERKGTKFNYARVLVHRLGSPLLVHKL
jgi:hypothetical protein